MTVHSTRGTLKGRIKFHEEGDRYGSQKTEHPDHLGRRHRLVQRQRVQPRHHGYRTPNIDRIAKEGACSPTGTASRAAPRARGVHHRQSPIRTGLTKVGLPGADLGLQPEDPTIADILKQLGYVTGQFGKNHLGDRDEFLPTAHGFDEFFGNLYHLNAEEEPENPDYPKEPGFRKKFGPRGVLHSWANPDGTQKIEDTGPLTVKRMETVDGEFLDASLKFIDKAVKDDKPFFVWWNSTRMHIWTHLKKDSQGKTGLGVYPDGMVEHDGHVGKLLDKLDQLGIADNTLSCTRPTTAPRS
jgi:arylsulfatase